MKGASLRDIKEGLEKDKIVNGAGNKKWHVSNLNQILINEKHMGDPLLQKTYTVDFLNKKKEKMMEFVCFFFHNESLMLFLTSKNL